MPFPGDHRLAQPPEPSSRRWSPRGHLQLSRRCRDVHEFGEAGLLHPPGTRGARILRLGANLDI